MFAKRDGRRETEENNYAPITNTRSLDRETGERETGERDRREREREGRDMHATPIHYPEPAVSRGIVLLRENTCVRASQNISQKLNLKQHFMTSDVLILIQSI